MTAVTMSPRAEAFLISEANGSLSREAVTLDASAIGIDPGHLMHNDSGTWVPCDGAGTPASADGILLRKASTTDGVVIARDAEVDGNQLTYGVDTAMSAPEKATAIAQLAALGIIVR